MKEIQSSTDPSKLAAAHDCVSEVRVPSAVADIIQDCERMLPSPNWLVATPLVAWTHHLVRPQHARQARWALEALLELYVTAYAEAELPVATAAPTASGAPAARPPRAAAKGPEAFLVAFLGLVEHIFLFRKSFFDFTKVPPLFTACILP